MKLQGLSLTDIAEELHIPVKDVGYLIQKRFQSEASQLTDEDRQGILALENARLDYMLSKLWPSVEYGDVKSIMAALKITEVRLKANHMDVPSSTSTAQVLVVGGNTENYVERLKAMADGN